MQLSFPKCFRQRNVNVLKSGDHFQQWTMCLVGKFQLIKGKSVRKKKYMGKHSNLCQCFHYFELQNQVLQISWSPILCKIEPEGLKKKWQSTGPSKGMRRKICLLNRRNVTNMKQRQKLRVKGFSWPKLLYVLEKFYLRCKLSTTIFHPHTWAV